MPEHTAPSIALPPDPVIEAYTHTSSEAAEKPAYSRPALREIHEILRGHESCVNSCVARDDGRRYAAGDAMTTDEYQELKTLILDQTSTLVQRMHAEHAETREYVDLRVAQVHAELTAQIEQERETTNQEFKRTRQLIRSEFIKAAEHACTTTNASTPPLHPPRSRTPILN